MALMSSGLKVVVVKPPYPGRRSWRERLLSRPWRPWRAYRTVTHPMWGAMNDGDCYQFGDTIFINEQQFSELAKMPAFEI